MHRVLQVPVGVIKQCFLINSGEILMHLNFPKA